MERDSFIFYRSFYEAIKCMPVDVRNEIYPAICEYALFGKETKNLSEVARGVFMLMKPNIDVNTARYENGKKGAQYGIRGGRPKKFTEPQTEYVLTYEQEIEQMRNDENWRKTICEDYNISEEEYDKRLSRFLDRCNEDKERNGKLHHDSFADCQSHLRYWMTKAYKSISKTATSLGSLGRQLDQIDKNVAERQARDNDYLHGEALAEKLKGFRLSAPDPILPDNIIAE